MKTFVVNKGGERYPIRVVHWWPGRVYVDEWRTQVYSQVFRGCKYATSARTIIDGNDERFVMANATARCNPADVPNRKRGRDIAVGRLVKRLNDSPFIDGGPWRLEEEGKR